MCASHCFLVQSLSRAVWKLPEAWPCTRRDGETQTSGPSRTVTACLDELVSDSQGRPVHLVKPASVPAAEFAKAKALRTRRGAGGSGPAGGDVGFGGTVSMRPRSPRCFVLGAADPSTPSPCGRAEPLRRGYRTPRARTAWQTGHRVQWEVAAELTGEGMPCLRARVPAGANRCGRAAS